MSKDLDKYRDHIRQYLDEDAEDLYENAPCGYLSFAANGTIVKINTTLLNWIGARRDEVLYRKRFSDLLSIGGRIFYETHFAPLLKLKGSISEINFDLLRKSNDLLPVLVSCTKVRDSEGNIVLYRATVFDISERKKYEQELLHARKKAEQATRLKADFISTVSHEIRTPMNAIIGVSELLFASDPRIDQLGNLQILKTSSENLLNLINDILDFSKIEAGKVKVEERNINLKALVQSLVFSLNTKAFEKKIELRTSWDKRLPDFFVADPVKLTQILTNLLGNGIKFTDKGYVDIGLSLEKEKGDNLLVNFSVSDSGRGIAPDRLQDIFDEFTQESYDTNLQYGGTGLGLSISQKLLQLHNSQLRVQSKLGEGTRFFFSLQMKKGVEEAVSQLSTAPGVENIKGKHLLVADDNKINLLVAGQFLKSWGVTFDTAQNGREVLEKVKVRDYDLVLMDLQMPLMDGYEASRSIRAMTHEKYRKLPIIALSAASKEENSRIIDAGMNDFVTKPFRSAELQHKISYHTSVSYVVMDESRSEEKDAPVLPTEQAASLDFYREITQGKEEDYQPMLQLILKDLNDFFHGCRPILEKKDYERFGQMAHKHQSLFKQLKADHLWMAVENTLGFIAAQNREAICLSIEAIELSIQPVIKIVEDEMNKR